jgi:hypothetical protein
MTELFGPGWGNYAIRGIIEVTAPEPVSLLPQTPGWFVLAAVLALLITRLGWRKLRRWQHNRYRRDALTRLEQLRLRVDGGDITALQELAPLLRATALHAAPREQVASSSGPQWRAALAQLAPQLAPLPLDTFHRLAYQTPRAADAVDAGALFDQLEHWIVQHRGRDD